MLQGRVFFGEFSFAKLRHALTQPFRVRRGREKMQSLHHALIFAFGHQNQCLRTLTGDKQRSTRGNDVVEVGRYVLSKLGQSNVGQNTFLFEVYVYMYRLTENVNVIAMTGRFMIALGLAPVLGRMAVRFVIREQPVGLPERLT